MWRARRISSGRVSCALGRTFALALRRGSGSILAAGMPMTCSKDQIFLLSYCITASMASPVPTRSEVCRANGQRRIGEDLATWRRLRRLTAAQVGDRAGISRYPVMRLENGAGATMENLLRVARALGVLDQLVEAVDPYQTDVGRLRSQEALPQRVRPPRPGSRP